MLLNKQNFKGIKATFVVDYYNKKLNTYRHEFKEELNQEAQKALDALNFNFFRDKEKMFIVKNDFDSIETRWNENQLDLSKVTSINLLRFKYGSQMKINRIYKNKSNYYILSNLNFIKGVINPVIETSFFDFTIDNELKQRKISYAVEGKKTLFLFTEGVSCWLGGLDMPSLVYLEWGFPKNYAPRFSKKQEQNPVPMKYYQD